MKKKIDKWENYVGKEIVKHSGNPFKSGKKVGIVVSIGINPNSGKQGFNMDDGTIVDCKQCKLLETTYS